MARKILHVDLDAFFCAVEENRDESLRGKPFVVGGMPGQRGVVASASYAARQYGIRSAMPTGKALRLCPQLIIVHSRHSHYGDISDQVMERCGALTALVEQISIDEAFLDVSDLPQTGLEIAQKLQQSIRQELNLPCSLGVAANKLVAKMATDIGKASHRGKEGPPNAILVVPPGKEAEFFAPLPVEALWGVGPKTAARLGEMGIKLVGDILKIPERQLAVHFGKMGGELLERAQGIDDRPVITSHAAKSVSQETTFERDIQDPVQLERTLRYLSEKVCRRLRKDDLCGSTVRLKLRWADFTTITRQVRLRQPSDQDGIVYEAVCDLFRGAWAPGQPVRLLGVGVSGLGPGQHQLSLWDTRSEKEHRLLNAIDELRERYGSQIIQRASEIDPD